MTGSIYNLGIVQLAVCYDHLWRVMHRLGRRRYMLHLLYLLYLLDLLHLYLLLLHNVVLHVGSGDMDFLALRLLSIEERVGLSGE